MISCMNCVYAKPFLGPDQRIDFSKKICKEGPPTPVIVGVDPNHHPVVQYLHPVVTKDVFCGRFEDRMIGEPKPEGTATQ